MCCFNLHSLGGDLTAPVWQALDGALKLGGGGRPASEFYINKHDNSMTDGSGAKVHRRARC